MNPEVIPRKFYEVTVKPLLILFLFTCLGNYGRVLAEQDKQKQPSPFPTNNHKQVIPYKLEKIIINGSERISSQGIMKILKVQEGSFLDEDLIMSSRIKILSLGLFDYCLLRMKKGSKKGWAILVVDLEDDPSVYHQWGLGLGASLQLGTLAGEGDEKVSSLGLSFLARNMFAKLHRAEQNFRWDEKGYIREVHFTYDIPELATENMTFTTAIKAIDGNFFFLDSLAFSFKAQSLWITNHDLLGKIYVGPVYYDNKFLKFDKDLKSMPGAPQKVSGLKLGFTKETRLRTFIPQKGYEIESNLILAVENIKNSILELSLHQTIPLMKSVMGTLSATVLSTAGYGFAKRAEARIDLPMTRLLADKNDYNHFYIRFRTGSDQFKEAQRRGHSASIGWRYYTNGLITELSAVVADKPPSVKLKPMYLE